VPVRLSIALPLLLLANAALAQVAPPLEVVVTPSDGSRDPAESALCVKPARLADAPCPWVVRVREDEPGALRARKLGAQVSADGNALFVVLRRRSGVGMADELWRYRREVAPRRIAAGDALDFTIAADGTMVAFKDQDGVMRFVDADGRDTGEVDLAPIEAASARLAQRSGDLAAFVATRGLGDLERVLVVDVPKRQIVGYYVGGLYVGAEYALDLPGRRLAFSDYPRGLDAEGAARARADGQVFKLQVIDLETRATLFTAERVGEPFHPLWIGSRLTFAGREGPKRVDKAFGAAKP
jgi:hypothetical protein